MDFPLIKGITAKHAHVGIPDGTTEEEFARGGFFGKYAHLYRTQPLVNWDHIEGPLKPRSYRLSEGPKVSVLRQGLNAALENSDVKIGFFNLHAKESEIIRNADADTLLFVHDGEGELETDFGKMKYRKGDYLLIPRGCMFQLKQNTEMVRSLFVESTQEFNFPDKGILGQHALIDPSVIETPTPRTIQEIKASEKERKSVFIKRLGQWTEVQYPFNPFNAVGWKGTLTVLKVNVDDIRPISCDRYHLPPTAHVTFMNSAAVICSFLPRPLENGDEKAMKVPFYHLNIDYDEVLFYHDGDFFSRTGITPGMMTFHPQGIEHGPQPGAVSRTQNAQRTNEIAVMIDTVRPLMPTQDAKALENEAYFLSWKEGKK